MDAMGVPLSRLWCIEEIKGFNSFCGNHACPSPMQYVHAPHAAHAVLNSAIGRRRVLMLCYNDETIYYMWCTACTHACTYILS